VCAQRCSSLHVRECNLYVCVCVCVCVCVFIFVFVSMRANSCFLFHSLLLYQFMCGELSTKPQLHHLIKANRHKHTTHTHTHSPSPPLLLPSVLLMPSPPTLTPPPPT